MADETKTETMETNGRYFIWPDDIPMPDNKNRCYGCSTVLIVPCGTLDKMIEGEPEDGYKFTICPACGGDLEKLEHFQQRVKMYVEEGLHAAHAANKVRKEIREGVIEV